MKKLIDAKGKFVLNARDYTGHIIYFENGYATVFDRFVKAICKFSILDAPAVDAVPVVYGRWEYDENPDYDGNYQAYCSVCGAGDKHALYMIGCVPYCWKCGAKMDLEVKTNV